MARVDRASFRYPHPGHHIHGLVLPVVEELKRGAERLRSRADQALAAGHWDVATWLEEQATKGVGFPMTIKQSTISMFVGVAFLTLALVLGGAVYFTHRANDAQLLAIARQVESKQLGLD